LVQDIFTFGPEEMLSISPAVMEHRLNVSPIHRPVVQKKRHVGPERAVASMAEVEMLLETGFIRECQYPKWILNAVVIPPTPTARSVTFSYFLLNFWGETDHFQTKSLMINPSNQRKHKTF